MKITSLFLEITNLCNKTCSYCYNKEDNLSLKKHSMSENLFCKIIDEANDIGIDTIIVSGGEPTMHPQFCNMIQYIIQKNMYCKINSNAYSEEKLVSISKQFGDKIGFQFTIDGYYTSHDKFRGHNDYRHVLSLIKKIREQGYDGIISLRYNLHTTDFCPSEITEVYSDFGGYIDYIYISPIIGASERIVNANEYIIVSQMVRNINPSKAQIQLFTPPLSCTLMHITDSSELLPLIDVWGNIYLCQMSLYNKKFCLGNVADNILDDILSTKNIIYILDEIKKNLVCKKHCVLGVFCDGGCKGLLGRNGCDGFCELRKTILINDIKIKKYQCWG